MGATIEFILLLSVVLNLMMLGTTRLRAATQFIAVQGIALGYLPLIAPDEALHFDHIALALLSAIVRGVVFPYMILRARSAADVKADMGAVVRPATSVMLGVTFLAYALWLGGRLPMPRYIANGSLVLSVSVATIFTGLFLIIARRRALVQALGYLVFENGLYTLAVGLHIKEDWLVQLGVMLDVFVLIFIMGIIVYHISNEFDEVEIDVDALSALKERQK